MPFPYKNPLNAQLLSAPYSVPRNSVQGTDYSVLGIGGWMEVANLSDLSLTFSGVGLQTLSANTIPINLYIGNGTPFNPSYVNLNSDNFSSGRRRVGMIVYVNETGFAYQYQIDNYESLWNAATGATGTVTSNNYDTQVRGNSAAGQNFINAWTGSTIEGVSGTTRANARWRIFHGTDTFVTGGTYFSATSTINLYRNDGVTIPISGITATGGSSSNGFTGGTVSGATNFTGGLTANTISATTYQNLPNTIFTGGTVSGATNFTGGLTANTISATTYQNLSSNFKNEIHVSQVDGNDTTGNGSLLNPVATITKALTLITGQRRTIIIHPGNYTENPSITTQYTVLTTYELLGGNTLISGTISTNVGCTISGIKMTNLTNTAPTGTGNVNILNCEISGTLTKSSNADYTVLRLCDYGAANITGAGLVAIFGGNPNFTTVNNASANVIIKSCTAVAPVLTAGTLSIVDSIVIAAVTNAFTSAAGTVTTLSNSQFLTSALNNVAPIVLNGFYSIISCVFDKPASTLVEPSGTGGSTNSIDNFQYINADKFMTQGGTSSKYVMGDGSLSNGFTGGTITGATNFTNGLTANTISATTYQNLPATPFLPLSGGTVTGATIFTGGLTANTISATTYQNLPATPFLPLSGGTVSGATIFTGGLTANTISATTYYNLPTDVFVTGGTYTSGNVIFTNNTGGTFNVSGFTVGGGGGQIFYLNLSQSQNGNRLLSTTGSTSSEQSTGVTINNGVTSTIASFQSQPLNITLLPGGIWSFYLHSYKQNNNASFNIFVEVYKITSGGTQTLLFTTDPASVTTNSPNPSMQLSDGYFSGTPLSVSDSIVAVVRATNTGNQSHIITLVSEGSQHYSYAVSTIPTQQGLTCDTLSGCSIIQTIQTDVSNKLDKSGGTITGDLIINSGLTATTISATTYYNLPNTSFTGGTVSGATNFTNDLKITGINSTSGLTRYLVVDTSGNTYHQTGGDMILGSAQTNSGAKTFLDTTLLLRNTANTFNGSFVNTNTADRIYTLPDTAGTIALTSNLSSYVPYTGATANVSLGANSLFTTTLGVGISSSLSSTAHIRGTSASAGSAFLVQNSTPANVFNVLNNGFVGVGSNTPISLLHIGTSTATTLGDFTTPAITFNTLNQGIYLDSNRLFFKVAGAFNFGIDSTGVLGNQFRINGAASNNVTTPIFVPSRTSLGPNSGFGGNNAGDICLITNSNTRLRINYNGDLGFFGVTPVARQTLGAATAGATYTATEQGMLQRVYDALRNYGLGT